MKKAYIDLDLDQKMQKYRICPSNLGMKQHF